MTRKENECFLNPGIYGAVIAAQCQNQRMQEQRRMEEEMRRRKRQEEEEEQQRRMIEHRKNSPVIYNKEKWQMERCFKAFTMQPSVQRFLDAVEKERPEIIKAERQKLDQEIIENGIRYESERKELGIIIESLRKTGITIEGTQYEFNRLMSDNTSVAKPKQTTDFFGSTFKNKNEEPLELNPYILADEDYYVLRYKSMNSKELEEKLRKATSKLRVYQRFGKFLGFLLRTHNYLDLAEQTERLTELHEQYEQRKRELKSYQSLSKEQLSMIIDYFDGLCDLEEASTRIGTLSLYAKELYSDNNDLVYQKSIKAAITKKENSEIVDQAQEYIRKLEANDEETMKEAYELVKGEYPIQIPNAMVYRLIFDYLRDYKKEKPKEKKYS